MIRGTVQRGELTRDPRGYVSPIAPLATRPPEPAKPAQALPPSSNRGESGDAEGDRWVSQTVGVDWLTFCGSFPDLLSHAEVKNVPRALEKLQRDVNDTNAAEVVAWIICKWYGLDERGLKLEGQMGRGRVYDWKVRLIDRQGNFAGTIEFGGEHTKLKTGDETFRVDLTGRGCAQFEGRSASGAHQRSAWAPLRAKLESGPATWITRADPYCDSYDGQYTVEQVRQWWLDGMFNNRGQRPQGRFIDDMGSKKGCTFYVGSSKSPKQLRVYDKGKELGNPESVYVRFEAQLRNAGGRIDASVLTEPGAALRGAYACLDFVADMANRVYEYKQRATACVMRAAGAIKKQYGATMRTMQKMMDAEQFAGFLKWIGRDKQPPWAKEQLLADEWPRILAAVST